MVDKGPSVLRAVVGMDCQSRPLVAQKDVFVLVHDPKLWRGDRKISVFRLWRIEKLVVDVHLHQVSLPKPGVPLGPAAVDLDALEPDVLLTQGRRQQRYRFRNEPVQPLARVVFPDGKGFHGFRSFSFVRFSVIIAHQRQTLNP